MKSELWNRFVKKRVQAAAKTCRLGLERLEDRLVLSGDPLSAPVPGLVMTASLSNGLLKVVGTLQNDNITLKQTNGQIKVLGLPGTYSASLVSRIEVQGLNGNDWIRLDSEALGGQPILKPTLIKGGSGNDLLFGSAVADQIFGEAGDDTLHGRNGNDLLDGGMGRDTVYGGQGNDTIPADFADGSLAGQAHVDLITFHKLDPAPLANNTPAILKAAIQSGLAGVSFSKTSNGSKFSVSELKLDTVTIENGITTIALTAKVRVQQYILGKEVASSTGSLKFSVQPQLSATLTDAVVTKATIGLANVKVKEMNLNNVPNWIDNNSEVRDFLESKFAAVQPLVYINQLQSFLALGGSLGPSLFA